MGTEFLHRPRPRLEMAASRTNHECRFGCGLFRLQGGSRRTCKVQAWGLNNRPTSFRVRVVAARADACHAGVQTERQQANTPVDQRVHRKQFESEVTGPVDKSILWSMRWSKRGDSRFFQQEERGARPRPGPLEVCPRMGVAKPGLGRPLAGRDTDWGGVSNKNNTTAQQHSPGKLNS